MFQGHEFIKLINGNWVLDITEFTGYKVKTDSKGNVVNHVKAFRVVIVEGKITFEKYIAVPVKVLKEATSVVSGVMERL